jgi:penicillin-binding protein 1C
VLVASNAKLPPPLRRLTPGALPTTGAAPPLRIMFPPDGARLELAGAPAKPEPLPLKISGGVGPLTVLVNGAPVAGAGRTIFWQADGPGFVRLTVMDARGAADSVMVRVQ